MKPVVLATTFLLGFPVLAKAQTVPVALTHVRIIDGTGAAPTEDGTVVMQDGIIVTAGHDVPLPSHAKIIDRSGMTVLPGLVSDHSHAGQLEGLRTGAQFYTAETITSELAQYRRYGVTTVTALGNNAPKVFDPMRKNAHLSLLPADMFGVDQGIGVPKGAPPVHVAPDQLFRPHTPEQARQNVDAMADEGTDLVKIWVDDFDHSLPVKMDPAIIEAVVDEAHKKHLRVAAHIHDLDDAQRVVASGVDILAHGVRDKPVPPSFVQTLKEKGIWYIPTLQLDEATTVWADQPAWVHAPYVVAGLSAPLRQQINSPAWRKENATGAKAEFARKSLAMNLQNVKTLWDAGVKIGFGTDSGATPLRVPGIAEHRELALMVSAGLSPLQALHVATQQAALLLNLHDRGVIAAGRRADLLVVAGNPANTIADTDKVVETWESGNAVAGPVVAVTTPLSP